MNIQAVLERRRTQQRELLELARSFVAEIQRRHTIRAAVVYGSVARGDFNLWSDVDLLVVAEDIEGNPLERMDALGPRPPLVQPIVWTPEEWREQARRGNAIAHEAVEAGVWLRGSPDDL